MAAPQAQLRVSRYFAVLAVIIVALYALMFFTGDGSITNRAKPKLGLDLQGGQSLTLTATTVNGGKPSRDDMDTARRILTSRVDDKGVAEPEVLLDGDTNIVINVPGKNTTDIKRIGDPAKLRFREVLSTQPDQFAVPPKTPAPAPTGSPTPAPSGSPKPAASPSGSKVTPGKSSGTGGGGGSDAAPAATPSPSASASPAPSAAPPTATDENGVKITQAEVLKKLGPEIDAAVKQVQDPAQFLSPQAAKAMEPVTKLTPEEIAVLPTDYQLKIPQITCPMLAKRPVGSIQDEKQPAVACSKDAHEKLLLDKSTVVGEDVKDANYSLDNTQGWKVTLDFKGDGQDAWTKLTQKALQKQVAVVLDNTVITAPTIQSVISGPAEITGKFTQQEAKDLATDLKFGALPLSFKTQTAETVTATLGLESLKSGLLAGGIGLVLVVIYSLIYYRALGFVTIASLVASAAIIFASIVLLGRQIGFTLTLAGVAGFIVAVGITADSFVVFFERLKDEVKDGRSVRTAVPRAWVRARRTILSADSVSFLAAATLYIFAIGAVQGFAFTLGLSTMVDVLIVFLFTHPLVALLARSKTFTSPRISGLGSLREPATVPAAGSVTTKES